MPNFRHLITIIECFLTRLSIKYWKYVVSFCKNAKFCSGDRKFNHLELSHWQIALYTVSQNGCYRINAKYHYSRFFLCPGYQSTERDDLKFILKFICKYHCVLFIHFPPKYVYLFKMLLTLYYDGKGDIKIYFWGNKSWYLPNVLGINNCLLCRTTGVNYISYNVF